MSNLVVRKSVTSVNIARKGERHVTVESRLVDAVSIKTDTGDGRVRALAAKWSKLLDHETT